MELIKAVLTFIAVGWAAAVGICMLAGIGMLFVGMRKRSAVLILFGAVALMAPPLTHLIRRQTANHTVADRAAAVAAMPRTPLRADYPRRLRIVGDINNRVISALMNTGYFDSVQRESDGWGSVEFLSPARTQQCRAAARIWLDQSSGYSQRAPVARNLDLCVTVRQIGTDKGEDAIILRTDRAATLRRPRGEHWLNGEVELWLRRNGQEQLVDYREKTYVTRPIGLFSIFTAPIETGPEPDPVAMLLERVTVALPQDRRGSNLITPHSPAATPLDKPRTAP